MASDYQTFFKHQAFGSCPYGNTWPYLYPLCPSTSGVFWERTKSMLKHFSLKNQILLCGRALQVVRIRYAYPVGLPVHHLHLLRKRGPDESLYGSPCVHLPIHATNSAHLFLSAIGLLGALTVLMLSSLPTTHLLNRTSGQELSSPNTHLEDTFLLAVP